MDVARDTANAIANQDMATTLDYDKIKLFLNTINEYPANSFVNGTRACTMDMGPLCVRGGIRRHVSSGDRATPLSSFEQEGKSLPQRLIWKCGLHAVKRNVYRFREKASLLRRRDSKK